LEISLGQIVSEKKRLLTDDKGIVGQIEENKQGRLCRTEEVGAGRIGSEESSQQMEFVWCRRNGMSGAQGHESHRPGRVWWGTFNIAAAVLSVKGHG